MRSPAAAAEGRLDPHGVVSAVLDWYDGHARDLPWRRPGTTAWQVLVSEVMLQQTPVARVLGPWQSWVSRWPTPADLAAAPVGEAVRAWGRLGYPRRALRLHQAATAVVERHGGEVPGDHAALLALPGVGTYTAAAVASFGFGGRHVVLDTNVRRVLSRVALGRARPGTGPTRAEVALAERFLPEPSPDPRRAARWAVSAMELGALVCTARSPRCGACPVSDRCAWRQAGRPVEPDPRPRQPGYAGTDRQCRGALLAVLRAAAEPVPVADLYATWPVGEQAERALASLVSDGLAVPRPDGRYALP